MKQIPEWGARPHRYFQSTLSTMTEARQWLAENPALPTGAAVWADEQRAGKGRLGRTWLTPPQSAIAMSFIVRQDWALASLTMLAGVAVAEVLGQYASEVNLKWPNDVQIGSRKVAGILAESLWDEQNQFQAAILGIGINLTVDFGGSDLAESATSLADHTRQNLDRFAISAAILAKLDEWLGDKTLGLSVFGEWKKRLSTLGQQVHIYLGERVILGLAVDVESDGALVLELADGTRQRFLGGEVSLRSVD